MAHERSRNPQAETDRPEPEDVLSDEVRGERELQPSDAEDREAEPQDPREPDPPVDDADRDPASRAPVIDDPRGGRP